MTFLPTHSKNFQTMLWGSRDDFMQLIDQIFEDFHFFDFEEMIKKDNYPISNVYIGEDQSIKITIAVTGWDKKDISISVEDGSIVVSGTEGPKIKPEEAKWRLIGGKIKKNSFTKRIRLSNRLDYEKAEASINDGLLTIIIPPKDEIKPKSIEIK